MALFRDDIKLLESERLTDNSDGGGRLTGNEVEDGKANNLFPDISSLDRTTGRVNLRKGYPAVLSPNTDRYYGANVIISDMPDDPNVFAALFTTGSHTDERGDAADRVESYVVEGPQTRMYPLGTQVKGQRQIKAYQRPDAALPGVGESLMLEDVPDGERQFVRIRDVESEEATFEDTDGVFTRTIVTMDIGRALEHEFSGRAVERTTDQADKSPTAIHSTTVADAARYYSTTPVAEALSQGDLTLPVERVFTPLVPSTQSEEPISDADLVSNATVTVTSGGEDFDIATTSYTDRIEIENTANRQFNYNRSLVPKPQPGTLRVAYRAQGNWQLLVDEEGEGRLTGIGSGSIDYNTGTVEITVAELPDVPSAIIFFFAEPQRFKDRSGQGGSVSLPVASATFGEDSSTSWVPGSVTVEWTTAGGSDESLTDDGEGNIGTDGVVIYGAQGVRLQPSIDKLPAPGSDVKVTSDAANQGSKSLSDDTDNTGTVSFDLGEEVSPGSVQIEWQVLNEKKTTREWNRIYSSGSSSRTDLDTYTYIAQDDGNGGWKLIDGPSYADSISGQINYTDGTGDIQLEQQFGSNSLERSRSQATSKSSDSREVVQSAPQATWVPASEAGQTFEDTIPFEEVRFNLLELLSGEVIIPGTVRFRFNGRTYGDRDGEIISNPGSSDSVVDGYIDYVQGTARLTDWPGGTDGLEIETMITLREGIGEAQIVGRTSSSPLKVGSFDLQVTTLDGDLITAFADNDGNITDESGRTNGHIDWDTGVFDIEFGEWDSGEFNIRDGNGDLITPVLPFTARYNTVAFSFIPLDPDILGLDPVRLPQDGRVPFFRPGDVAVIHHTQTTDIGDGSTETTLRDHVAFIHVFDDEGTQVDEADLNVDLEAGTVEVTNATPYVTPFTSHDRIEQMRLVAEVQISGFVVVDRAITRDFPADAKVSSALLYGDLEARVTNVFEQKTWQSNWSDELEGDAPDASFNDVDFPIAVTNDGAAEDRWALVFDSTTSVDVIGETVGQVLENAPIDSEIAPTNPVSGQPYFTIDPDGWGSGWSTGNVVRFNTSAANAPMWIARTILAGEETAGDDEFTIQIRGDAQ